MYIEIQAPPWIAEWRVNYSFLQSVWQVTLNSIEVHLEKHTHTHIYNMCICMYDTYFEHSCTYAHIADSQKEIHNKNYFVVIFSLMSGLYRKHVGHSIITYPWWFLGVEDCNTFRGLTTHGRVPWVTCAIEVGSNFPLDIEFSKPGFKFVYTANAIWPEKKQSISQSMSSL